MPGAYLAYLCVGLVGGTGGVLNAVVTDNAQLWPLLVRDRASSRIVRPGLLLNAIVGAAASVAVFYGVGGSERALAVDSLIGAFPPLVVTLVAGFLTSRWWTGETDKQLLRAALGNACAAPAAHPDTVRALEISPPYAAYRTTCDMLPRSFR